MTRSTYPLRLAAATDAEIPADDALVFARGLVKRYGDEIAVDGISFDLSRGEALGILGPNGAGKSSTMRMIAGMSPVSAGVLRLFGWDPIAHGPSVRARLGVVPQDDCLDTDLTVWDNLYLYGRYFGLPRKLITERIAALLEFVQLADRTRDIVETLSGGQRRRVTIARALINEPDMLLLDEPTTGLDPQARHLLWERLRRIKRDGKSLILTTHYMEEAEQLCDRVIIMDRGRIVADGTTRDLVAMHIAASTVVELRYDDDDLNAIGDQLSALAQRLDVLPGRILVYGDDGERLLESVKARRLQPQSAIVRRTSLEDVFLVLTGRSLTE